MAPTTLNVYLLTEVIEEPFEHQQGTRGAHYTQRLSRKGRVQQPADRSGEHRLHRTLQQARSRISAAGFALSVDSGTHILSIKGRESLTFGGHLQEFFRTFV